MLEISLKKMKGGKMPFCRIFLIALGILHKSITSICEPIPLTPSWYLVICTIWPPHFMVSVL